MKFLALFLGIWLIPVVLVAPSRRLDARQRVVWSIVVLLTSWFGWLLFSILAPGLSRHVVDEFGRRHPLGGATPPDGKGPGEGHKPGPPA